MLTGETAALLQQITQAAGDTILMKPVNADRDWFDTLTSLASIVISIALIVLAVGLLPAAWNLRNSHKKFNDLLDRVYGDINPLVRHAHNLTDNLDYITTAIRVDLQLVNQTIATANDRLLEAVKQTEQRMREFNALVDVVQQEAEDVFVATASTVRGVRAGAATFQDESVVEAERRAQIRAELLARRHRQVAAEDELARLEAADVDDDTEDELYLDGPDDDDDGADDPLQAELMLADDPHADTGADATVNSPLGELTDDYRSTSTLGGRGEEKPRIRPRRGGARGGRA